MSYYYFADVWYAEGCLSQVSQAPWEDRQAAIGRETGAFSLFWGIKFTICVDHLETVLQGRASDSIQAVDGAHIDEVKGN